MKSMDREKDMLQTAVDEKTEKVAQLNSQIHDRVSGRQYISTLFLGVTEQGMEQLSYSVMLPEIQFGFSMLLFVVFLLLIELQLKVEIISWLHNSFQSSHLLYFVFFILYIYIYIFFLFVCFGFVCFFALLERKFVCCFN